MKNRYNLITLLITSLVCLSMSYYLKQDEGVFTLTDENFDYVIRDYDYLLVEFVEPSCLMCT